MKLREPQACWLRQQAGDMCCWRLPWRFQRQCIMIKALSAHRSDSSPCQHTPCAEAAAPCHPQDHQETPPPCLPRRKAWAKRPLLTPGIAMVALLSLLLTPEWAKHCYLLWLEDVVCALMAWLLPQTGDNPPGLVQPFTVSTSALVKPFLFKVTTHIYLQEQKTV